MKFVKTQHARFSGNFRRYSFKRVGLTFQPFQTPVYFRHKCMKMHPALTAIWQTAVKSIHQKTFAPPYSTIEIQTFRYLRRTQAASQKTVTFAFEHHQFRPQPVKMLNGACLCLVTDKTRFLRSGLIPSQRAVIIKLRGNKKIFTVTHYQPSYYRYQITGCRYSSLLRFKKQTGCRKYPYLCDAGIINDFRRPPTAINPSSL